MRIDRQTISYWSMNEKESALVIDVLQQIGNASVDKVELLIGENRRTANKYRQEVRDFLQQIGEPATIKDEDEIVTPLTEEEVAEINSSTGRAPSKVKAQDYGPFIKRND